jgi:hypothetical protein
MRKILEKLWIVWVVISFFLMINMITAWFIIWDITYWVKSGFLSMNIMVSGVLQFIYVIIQYSE